MARAVVVAATMSIALAGCGTSDGTGGSSTQPTTHALFANQPEMTAAGQSFEGTFNLPVDAAVSYTVTNRSTTSPDHWDVSIVEASELHFFENGQPYRSASPLHQNVSTISDSGSLTAGDYALAIMCDNILENCQFSIDLSATF
jgi:hypothetical protein